MNNRKYIMAAVGTFLLMILGTFFAWSLYRVYVSDIFPRFSATQLSLNFSLFVVIFCLGSLLAGVLSKKLGCHIIILISAALIAAGTIITNLMFSMDGSSALTVLYIGYGGFCGFGVGMSYNAILSGVGKWFPDRSGFISGLLLTGYGMGSLVCGTVVSYFADRVGFPPAFLWSSLIIAAVIAALSVLFRKSPEAQVSSAAETGLTTSQILKTPTLWFHFMFSLFAGGVGLMVINSAALIAVYFGIAAVLGLMVSLFNGFGRILSGMIFDKLHSKSIYVVVGMGFASAILLISAHGTGSVLMMFAGMLIAGLSYGSSMSVTAALTREFYGMKHYAPNFAVITLAGIPSSFMGPYISGRLQDASGGDYLTTFYAMLVFAALALICALGVSFFKKKLPQF